MKNISEKKTIDVTGVNFSPIATFKQGDAAVLKLELFKNGEVFNITGQTVKLGAYRPNKTIVEQLDGFTIDNNALTINLKNNILAVHGIVEVDLTLTDSAGEMTTASFYLKVNKKVLGNDNIAASDEIDSLKQIKLDLTALNENVKREENTRVANEKNRVSEEKRRQANEIERVNFYEDVAKPLVEDLSQYDKEIENIYHTIRENDYLPFEGENVTVEHSLTGMTKDMIIEGRTYQNVANYTAGYVNSEKLTNNVFRLKFGGNENSAYITPRNNNMLKANTRYAIIVDIINNTINKKLGISYLNSNFETSDKREFDNLVGRSIIIMTTKSELDINAVNQVYFCCWEKGDRDLTKHIDFKFMIIEESYYKDSLNYFEGIKSSGEDEEKIITVGVGKNILKPLKNLSSNSGISINYLKNGFRVTSNGEPGTWRNAYTYNIKVKPNVKISLTAKKKVNSGSSYLAIRDKNSDYIGPNNIEGDRAVVTTPSDGLIKLYFYCTTSEAAVGDVEYTDIQLQYGENQANVPYVDYKDDRNEISLPFEDGLKGLVESGKDTFELREDGVYSVQRVEKVLFDGKETISRWFVFDILNNDDSSEVAFGYELEKPCKDATNSDPISDKFPNVKGSVYQHKGLSIALNNNGKFYIRIPKTLLSEVSINGLRAWLQANPITVYYELAEPIETKLDIPSLNMKTFNEVTHIYFENSISPNAKFKAPVNVPATISSLRTRNESLEQENKELKEEVSVKTLKLHDQDVELTNSDLDLDFRIFELEMNIGLPINLNIKGVKNMARSPFEMMKILILNNNYDREDIEYKASRYLKGGRITQAEYDEIISLMDANELVK